MTPVTPVTVTLRNGAYTCSVKLEDSQLREALNTIHPGALTHGEAAAIVDVARFAASVDGRMDMSEMATVARLSKIVYAMSGGNDAPVPATQMAAGWLDDIGKRLGTTGPRELAYACARLIVLVDRKVTKDESELGVKLTAALQLSATRAQELDRMIDALFGSPS